MVSNLALDLRPERLDDLVGNEPVKAALKSLLEKDQIPTCMLFVGPPGCGKTTVARIVARAVQRTDPALCDIRQLNGADKRKIEDIRSLIEDTYTLPFSGRYRVFIIDECHQLTPDASQALLIPTEQKNGSTLWLFCSTDPEKIPAALRSRCSAATFRLQPLAAAQIKALVQRSAPGLDAQKITEFLVKHKVASPREILGACDLHLAGTPLEECVFGADHQPEFAEVARAVVAGNWDAAREKLVLIKSADVAGLRAVLSAFLGHALVQTPIGPKARALSGCLLSLSQTFEQGVAYQATRAACYRCCEALSQTK